ncbi:MAG: hypothetical protein DDT42_02027 [candidate division WS2 bacterium]|uniref:Uncharacterized protein n=1 Tax=Psychracetigena formicireducens TaxID=2986056 RepID=A0A9E2F788_PSYF1|nr:hypothetical protein [Candidatus Psychracetigena formicireducens]
MDMSKMITMLVTILVGMILISHLMPVGLDEFYRVNTTRWAAGVTSLWSLIALFVIIGLLLAVLRFANIGVGGDRGD